MPDTITETKMVASKENAAEAIARFLDITESPEESETLAANITFVHKFLKAAELKLPSDAAYKKDAKRNKKK